MIKHENLDAIITLYNNRPLEDFCGLTPNEMDSLLYEPYGEGSPIRLREVIAERVLERIPFFRLVEELLKLIQREKYIQLTPGGALKRIVMNELYGHRFIPHSFIEHGISKVLRENEIASIGSARIVAHLMKAIRKSNNRLSLTKRGHRLLESASRGEFFREVLKTFTEDFNWSYNDLYPDERVGQQGWGFTLVLLLNFGDVDRPSGFYADNYLQAFPHMIGSFTADYTPPEEQFAHCFRIRTFDRFLEWFGFVKFCESDQIMRHNHNVRRTELMERVFVAR